MFSGPFFWFHFLLTLQRVTGIEPHISSIAASGSQAIHAAGSHSFRARDDEKFQKKHCGFKHDDLFFTGNLGEKAFKTFCDGLAGNEQTPWRHEEGPVVLNRSNPWFSTTYHWHPAIFDFRVDALNFKPSTTNHNFGVPQNKWDCITTLSALVTSCCKDDNQCSGGSVLSGLGFRYAMQQRSRSEPPHWSSALKCRPTADPQNDLDYADADVAIQKFCKHSVRLGGDEGEPSFNQTQIPGFEAEFPGIEIKFSTFSRKWDGTCSKSIDLAQEQAQGTCVTVLRTIVADIRCPSFGRSLHSPGGEIYMDCGLWGIKRKPST